MTQPPRCGHADHSGCRCQVGAPRRAWLLKQFAEGGVPVLACTNLASRGIDFADVDHVVSLLVEAFCCIAAAVSAFGIFCVSACRGLVPFRFERGGVGGFQIQYEFALNVVDHLHRIGRFVLAFLARISAIAADLWCVMGWPARVACSRAAVSPSRAK